MKNYFTEFVPNMRKIALLPLFIVLILASCQKEISFDAALQNKPEEIPLFHISCKIDGVAKSFDVLAQATILNDAGQNVLSIFGKATSEPDDIERINIGIGSIQPIGIGVYGESDPSFTYIIDAIYTSNYSLDMWALPASPRPGEPFSISITRIDSNLVQGSFKGMLYSNSGTGNFNISITDGEFVVPF